MKKKLMVIALLLAVAMTACEKNAETDQSTEAISEDTELFRYKDIQTKLISLGDYSNLTYEKQEIPQVTDEDVDEEIDQELSNYMDEEGNIPELTDEFVSENLNYDTVEIYRDALKDSLQKEVKESVEYEIQYELLGQVVAASEFEFVEEDAEEYAQSVIDYYKKSAEDMGLSYEEMVGQVYGFSVEEFEKQAKMFAKDDVESILVCVAIQEQESLPIGVEKEAIDYYDCVQNAVLNYLYKNATEK